MFRMFCSFIAFIFCFLLASAEVQATFHTITTHFFFDSTNEAPSDADVIAEVVITDSEKVLKFLVVTVDIVKVIRTSDARVSQGDKIAVKSALTGCDLHEKSGATGMCYYSFSHNPGDKGTIIAKAGTDIDGRLVLCPYTNGGRNGRINPPLAGECDPSEMEKARQIKLAAENGDVKAQTALGLMYGEGRNTKQNTAEALKWLRLAAESGDAEALYQLGVEYRNGNNGTEALRHFKLAAAQGHTGAMYDIGLLYGYYGYGVKGSESEAEKWYRLAAENGNERAKYTLNALKKRKLEKLKRNIVWGAGILAGAGLIVAVTLLRRTKLRRTKDVSK